MTSMSTREKREFLKGVHVGVLSIPEAGSGPLTVPVWYDYELDGELWFITGRESRKGKLLDNGTRVSLCAQSETPPYRYVSVEGPVVAMVPADRERDLRRMAIRYLGEKRGAAYAASSAEEDSVVVMVRPERWLAVDYSKS